MAGLLFELPSRGEGRVLGRAVGSGVERPGRDLEEDAPGRRAVLANEEDAIGVVEGDDRHCAGVADDVALAVGPVGELDRVGPEGEVVAAVEDPGIDDALVQMVGGVVGKDLGDHWVGSGHPRTIGRDPRPGGRGSRPQALDRPAASRAASGSGGPVEEAVARLGVEHVDPRHRDVESQHVAGPHHVRGRHDRDEVLSLEAQVDQLVVAEVFDDVGLGLDCDTVGDRLAELEVLRAEPDDDLASGRGTDRGLVAGAEGHGDRGRLQDHLAGRATALHRQEVHGRAADEAGHELVHRVVVQLLGLADLLELGFAHDRDPLAHRHRLDLVVGDVDHGDAEALVEPGDLGARLDAELGVEVGERLVHQEDRRLANDRPAQGDALALAARELLGLAVEEAGQLDRIRRSP